MNTTKIAFQVENARLLEKLRGEGFAVNSFDGWKAEGKWVKKGEKTKAFRVQSGSFRTVDCLTGEDLYEPKWATAYGFTAAQVR